MSWSADGSQVLYAQGLQIVAVEPDGSRMKFRLNVLNAAARFGFSSEGPRNVTYAAMSTDRTDVVYSDCRSRTAEIGAATAVVHTPTNRRRLLATNAAAPAWSPDGTRIAFVKAGSIEEFWTTWEQRTYGRILQPGVYTVAGDGSDLRQVGGPGEAGSFPTVQPAWSPDGAQLVFASRAGLSVLDPDDWVELYTVGVDESVPRRLTTAVSGPAWSPDGTRLAFAKQEGTSVVLYTIAADGSDPQQVTTASRGGKGCLRASSGGFSWSWVTTVAWSPDGSKILYTCHGVVHVVAVDGTPVGRSLLYQARDQVVVAAWSPDGTRIAVGSGWELPTISGRFDKVPPVTFGNVPPVILYTMAPDGSDMRILLRNGDRYPEVVGERRQTAHIDATWCGDGGRLPGPVANPGLVDDCLALLAVWDSLANAPELNWSADRSVGAWDGVVLGGWPLRVTELNLANRGLRGVIPPELGRLTQLRMLNLSGNRLGGVIPPELGRLTQLRVLDLNSNIAGGLGGGIPPELGWLAQLRELRLGGNYLAGPIPPVLGGLSELRVLGLGGNYLAGPIPPELGGLAHLQELWLQGNYLAGPLPPELGGLTQLGWLGLSGNHLTGEVPAGLGRLNARLWLSGNQLTGCLSPQASVADRDQVGLPDCKGAPCALSGRR